MTRPVHAAALAAALALALVAAPVAGPATGSAAPEPGPASGLQTGARLLLAQAGQPDAPRATEEQVAPLLDALGMGELLPVMRDEGLDYAADLAADMFPGRGDGRWPEEARRIYDTDRMRAQMEREMAARMAPAEIDALMQFFGSDLGQRIVGLEVSARRALLDPGVEEAAEAAAAALEASGDPRFALLRDFVEANELVEMNVVGALNSNWAFYQGLDAGGAFDGRLSEDQMLADVWGQEDEIRAETRQWVYSYLGLAYRPLADDELAAYTALSRTPEGEALNRALFAAFDRMFVRISRELGLAAATFMSGEDI